MDKDILVHVEDLKRYFKIGRNSVVKAVDGVNFDIRKGETLGLVGESGCGKTTCGRTILGMYPATGGRVLYDGEDVHAMSRESKRNFTKKAQIIFQDPYASLNPRMTAGDIIAAGIDIHDLYRGKDRTDRINKLLKMVGLNKEHASRFPHEFSGGQRQRIGIARALAVEPEFIVCDEPISALDVSIQAQIVNMLMEFQEDFDLTYLFIAHDLSMVKHISHRVGVMYLGHIVEITSSDVLYDMPLHPYTKALLSAIPIPDPDIERSRNHIELEGEVSSPIDPKPGCRFASRCRYAKPICKEETPELVEVDKDHFVACYLFEK